MTDRKSPDSHLLDVTEFANRLTRRAIVAATSVVGSTSDKSMMRLSRNGSTYPAREVLNAASDMLGRPNPISVLTSFDDPKTIARLVGDEFSVVHAVPTASPSASPSDQSIRRTAGHSSARASFQIPMPSSGSAPRLPPWSKDELILALDLYLRRGGSRGMSASSSDAIVLSQVLRSLPVHPVDVRRQDRFRTPSSVALKLHNLAAVDPGHPNAGMSNSGSGDRWVWRRWSDDPRRLSELAQTVLSLADQRIPDQIVADEEIDDRGRLVARRISRLEVAVVSRARRQTPPGPVVCAFCEQTTNTSVIDGSYEGTVAGLRAESAEDAVFLVCSSCKKRLRSRQTPSASVEDEQGTAQLPATTASLDEVVLRAAQTLEGPFDIGRLLSSVPGSTWGRASIGSIRKTLQRLANGPDTTIRNAGGGLFTTSGVRHLVEYERPAAHSTEVKGSNEIVERRLSSRAAHLIRAEPGIDLAALAEHMFTTETQLSSSLMPAVARLLVTRAGDNSLTMPDETALGAVREAATYEYPLTSTGYSDLLRSGLVKGLSVARLSQRFGSWGSACDLAGVECASSSRSGSRSQWTDQDFAEVIADFIEETEGSVTAASYGQWVVDHPACPSAQTIVNRFGGWTEAKRAGVVALASRDSFWEGLADSKDSI